MKSEDKDLEIVDCDAHNNRNIRTILSGIEDSAPETNENIEFDIEKELESPTQNDLNGKIDEYNGKRAYNTDIVMVNHSPEVNNDTELGSTSIIDSPIRENSYDCATEPEEYQTTPSTIMVDRIIMSPYFGSNSSSGSNSYLRYDPYFNGIRRDYDSYTPIRAESLSSMVLRTPLSQDRRPWSSTPLRGQLTPNFRFRPNLLDRRLRCISINEFNKWNKAVKLNRKKLKNGLESSPQSTCAICLEPNDVYLYLDVEPPSTKQPWKWILWHCCGKKSKNDQVLTDAAIKLPCNHVYHEGCIKVWLTQNRNCCPLCQREVVTAGYQDTDNNTFMNGLGRFLAAVLFNDENGEIDVFATVGDDWFS